VGKGGRVRTVPVTDWVKSEVNTRTKEADVWSGPILGAINKLAPCLCPQAGEELEQIQFLLGYVSVQTTERYLDANNVCETS
jgi:hypothetical protein